MANKILSAVAGITKAVSNASKSSGTTSGGATSPTYTPLGAYNDAGLKDSMPNVYQQLRSNSEKWHTATPEEQARLSAENEAIRSKYGYSGGSDGSQYINTAPTSTYQNDVQRLSEMQKKNSVEQFKQARDKSIMQLDKQKEEIGPTYQNQRNMASASSQLGARNFAEYLANRGLTNSGASAQGEINRQSALQNTFGNLGVSEAKAYDNIATAKTNAEFDYLNNITNANNQIEADYFAKVLEKNEQERAEMEALKKQSLYQYADDFQARIDSLLAQGYPPDSKEVIQLQSLRGEKIANQQSALANNALTRVQMGYSNAQIANALQMPIEDVEALAQYYKQLNQNELTSSNLNIEAQKLNNTGLGLNNQLAIKELNKPYSSGSGGSSRGSSSNKGLTYTQINNGVSNIMKNIDKDDVSTAEETANIMDNASSFLINNASSLDEVINVAMQNNLTPERVARAMAKKGYSQGDIGAMVETYAGREVSDEYLRGVLDFANS